MMPAPLGQDPPSEPPPHDPVLLAETLELLNPPAGGTVVDCTVGQAGHARAIADRLGPGGLLIGLDVDPHNLRTAQARLEGTACRVRLFQANFAELPDVLGQAAVGAVDGMLADLGVSTNQLFDARYGLSFGAEMPLDMRLDPRLERGAAELIGSIGADELANLLFELADERYSRRIARKIVEAQQISPIQSTSRLAALVRSAMPPSRGASSRGRPRIDPATRTFLALRMAVNRELENLDALLRLAPAALQPGGRLAVISFQSGEDRRIKHFFRSAQRSGLLKILTNKPLRPGPAELAANPRSRSAKLRVAQRC